MTEWSWVRAVGRHESTEFVGRAAELAAVGECFSRARVITLTGPGGVGKTRIALRAAQRQAADFPDGVTVAELSGLRDPELLPQAVAAAVGLVELAVQPPMEQLLEYYADKHALLVLDTCEHLVDAVAVFADILTHGSAQLSMLLTSRTPVALPGESVLPIDPLPEPAPDASERTSDALALFVARARAARPSFVLSDDNRAEVIALCRRVDCMPLAIELAAVRLRTLPLEMILRRLDDRFRLLSGLRSVHTRHQTLRATIEWSHDLCSEQERELWARLSVFAGGFTLAAVEAVCGGGELDGVDVIDLLLSLVDKSVVLRVDSLEEDRYRMLDTIREYGAERLQEHGRTAESARRHLEFFVRMATMAGQEWFGNQQIPWTERLGADLDNFRVALDYAVAHPGDRHALQLVNGLWGLWLSKSRLTEARHWIGMALTAESDPTPEHGLALFYGSYFGVLQSDPAAREQSAACRRVAEHLDDEFLRCRAEFVAALEVGRQGNLSLAEEVTARMRERAASIGDLFALVVSRIPLVSLRAAYGNPEGAMEEAERGLRELEHMPDERWARNFLLVMKVQALYIAGETGQAREVGQTILPSIARHSDTMAMAATVEFLSWIASGDSDDELAATLLGGAGVLWRSIGTVMWGQPALMDMHTSIENSLMLAMGAERFTAIYAHGAALPLPDLIDVAGGRTPARADGSDDDGGHALGPLTSRERQVAELIVEGLSNRQIAERLVISKRTVDAHLEHILSKLGCTSRIQVAAMISSAKPAS